MLVTAAAQQHIEQQHMAFVCCRLFGGSLSKARARVLRSSKVHPSSFSVMSSVIVLPRYVATFVLIFGFAIFLPSF
jgi:hypothetical protein